MKYVGYNDNIIKSQYSVRPKAGNVCGGEIWNIIDNTPQRNETAIYIATNL